MKIYQFPDRRQDRNYDVSKNRKISPLGLAGIIGATLTFAGITYVVVDKIEPEIRQIAGTIQEVFDNIAEAEKRNSILSLFGYGADRGAK